MQYSRASSRSDLQKAAAAYLSKQAIATPADEISKNNQQYSDWVKEQEKATPKPETKTPWYKSVFGIVDNFANTVGDVVTDSISGLYEDNTENRKVERFWNSPEHAA